MANLFTLEAVFAKKGDCLLLHYGPWDDPKMILIDAGPGGVYSRFLKKRIGQLREELDIDRAEPFPLEMVMVSHVDDDHVNGILQLFGDSDKARSSRKPAPYRIGTLWHNAFDDVLGNDRREVVSRIASTAEGERGGLALPRKITRETQAVVASTRQGRKLRNLAKRLRIRLNRPFRGLVMAPAAKKIELGHGLSFTIIGPLEEQVVAFQKRWDKDLKKILADEKKSAKAASFSDESAFNLASICVLATMKRKKMLLTGDARGDFVLEGLEQTGVLRPGRSMHVDILKLPHHGSDRNVEPVFFERITADHYVVSADGAYNNPDVETLEMIENARDNDRYTIHFTFTKDAHRTERSAKRRKALAEVMKWARDKPRNCTLEFRQKSDDVYSVHVDLLDPLNPA